MRKILFICLVLFSQIAFGQEQKFTGVAIFQLGSDTSVLYNYAVDMKTKVNATDDSQSALLGRFNKGNSTVIYRLFRNSDNTKNYTGMSYCADWHEFYVNSYKADGVLMEGITLKYYNNKLIYVECKLDKRLLDNVSAKFGKPKMSSKTDTINCNGADGKPQKLVNETGTIPWHIGDVNVRGVLQRTYDEHCRPQFHGIFAYAIDDKEAIACENEAKKKAK